MTTLAHPETMDELTAECLAQIERPYQVESGCLGPSKISTYQRCPQAYYLQYVAKLPTPSSPAATVGTVFHFVANQIKPNRWTAGDADKAGAMLLKLWEDARGLTTDPDNAEANSSINDAVLEWLPWYLWFANQGTDIDTEIRWTIEKVAGTDLTLQGTIDRLYLLGGKTIISDLKTGKRAMAPVDLRRDLQGTLYWWACREQGAQPSSFEHVMPRKQEALSTVRTDGDLDAALEMIVLPVARQIAAGEFPANPSPVYGCNYCFQQQNCRVGNVAA